MTPPPPFLLLLAWLLIALERTAEEILEPPREPPPLLAFDPGPLLELAAGTGCPDAALALASLVIEVICFRASIAESVLVAEGAFSPAGLKRLPAQARRKERERDHESKSIPMHDHLTARRVLVMTLMQQPAPRQSHFCARML